MKNYFILVFLALSSCTTYYIPVDSFKEQFSNVNESNLRDTIMQTPYGYRYNESINTIDSIKCYDKNGNMKMLAKKASLEIRFTEKNGKKTVFYFDKVYMQDTLIIGDQSRFIGASKTISINNVKKIEIQDGHKKFSYK